MSPDSRFVLIASMRSSAVSVLAQGPEGLSQAEGAAGCIANGGAPRAALPVADSLGRWTLRSRATGDNVYVASSIGDAIAILARNRAIGRAQPGARTSRLHKPGRHRWPLHPRQGLDEVWSVAVSPDGRNVYGVSTKVNMLGAMARDPSTGGLTQMPGRYGCFIRGRGGLLGCPEGRGLTGAVSVTVSRDGRNVYVASDDIYLGSVAIFRRRRVRRLALLTAAATVLLPVGGGLAQDPTPGAAASGPNVVVVMTDDQRFDDMPALPNDPTADRGGGRHIHAFLRLVSRLLPCPRDVLHRPVRP